MPRGGARPNSGPNNPVQGTRKWFRSLVEDPKLRAKVEKIIAAEVDEGNLTNYWKAVEHGFGRPPQALDVKVGGGDKPVRYVAEIAGGSLDPPGTEGVPDADLELGGTD